MKYDKDSYQSLLVKPHDLVKNKQSVDIYLQQVRSFLVDVYEGDYVCFLKKNFTELHGNLEYIAISLYDSDVTQLVNNKLNLNTISYSDHTLSSIRNISGRIRKSAIKDVVFVEDDETLFYALTYLKEILLTQGAIDEQEVLHRFSPNLKLALRDKNQILPTRVNVFLKVAELVKSNTNVDKNSLGEVCYKKFVYMAAKEGLSKSEYISAYVLPYLKNKPLNVLPQLFETELLQNYFEELNYKDTVLDNYLSLLGFMGVSDKVALGLMGKQKFAQTIKLTSHPAVPTDSVFELSVISRYFPNKDEYFESQKSDFLKDLLVACRVIYGDVQNVFMFPNCAIMINKYLKSLNVSFQSFCKLLPSKNQLQLQNLLKYYLNQLGELYPDKVVDENIIKDYRLSNNLHGFTALKGIQFSKFLSSFGFNVVNNEVAVQYEKLLPKSSHNITKNNQLYNELLKAYPNMVVVHLRAKYKKLYTKVLKEATINGVSVDEYLKFLGFSVRHNHVKVKNNDDYIKSELIKLYKDKPVGRISIDNPSLNTAILRNAKSNSQTRDEYIVSLGFTLQSSIENQLLQLYPDRKIVNLSIINPTLNQALYRKAKSSNMTVQDYANSIGFTLGRGSNYHKEKLQELYPNTNKVELLSVRNPSLYHEICTYSQRRKISISQYLETLGYEYITEDSTARLR